MHDDGRDLIIISDLHISSGYNRRTGTFDRNEDFFYDGAFDRFIDELLRRSTSEQRQWRLVILGDLIDFLQVDVPIKGTGHGLTSHETAAKKLERVARGHASIFSALGRFVASGHPVDIVIGNHDIEMIWPEIQQRIRELILKHVAGEAAPITFHPWIFYIPGLVYAEHGQQYDGLNSFTTLLQPNLLSDSTLIELPLGSFFVLYLFNRIEKIDPFADNVRPMTRYLSWTLRAHPIVAVSTLGYHFSFFVRVLRKTSNQTAAEQLQRRKQYRSTVMPELAQQIGLSAEVLTAIDEMAAVPALSNRWRQLEALLVRPLVPAFPAVMAFGAIYQGAKRLPPGLRSLVTIITGIAGLIWRERRLLRPATDTRSYLLVAAGRIHKLLSQHGKQVPAYVFGHTHTAERAPLTDGDSDNGPSYLNTGTWTPLVPDTFDLLSTRDRFSFVQITHNQANGEIESELLLWNDAANRMEPLPLMSR